MSRSRSRLARLQVGRLEIGRLGRLGGARFGIGRLGIWLLLSCGVAFLPAGAKATPDRPLPPPSDLTLETSAWIFPSRPIEIRIDQSGVLAGRRLAVYLFLEENQFERIKTKADRTRLSVALPPLTPGHYRLTARAGTAVAAADFRVLPWSWLAAPALAALGILLFVLAGIGRRRRRRATAT